MTDGDEEHRAEAGAAAKRTSDFVGALRTWVPLMVGCVVLGVLVRILLFQPYVIPSDSMMPTLVDGDRVLVNRHSYRAGEVERGQVVVFERPPALPGEDDVIKRVIGLPGETVRLIDSEVFIDSSRVVEPYLLKPASTRRVGTIPGCDQQLATSDRCVVPQGHVFVLGDNRDGSEDSRVFGPINIDTIIGRAFVRVWPLTDIARI